MQFDNKQFESNIRVSLESLDKLKQSLKLENAAEGFKKIGETARDVSFDGMNTAVDTVKVKFSLLEVAAISALSNIVNKAVDAGVSLVKSLTIDPVMQGFNEYELKMGSIQTIMASTGAEVDVVNKYLEELNTYSDKTIYSFSDMTNNIGKFTNAGVELEDAVSAIQGISNEAALSGANAQEASRAMYNFSQALSAGYVKLIDWKSIENANMATKGFKDQLIETAVALGKVVKTEEGYVTTTTDANGKVSEAFDATKNFNDSLSHQWMTTEVLTQTLKNYSTDIREMSDQEKTEYEERLKSIGYTEEQIQKIEELGMKAFDAAQDVKTWSQLVDTLKESVGSGWAQTFELIFGNLEEAKQLWSGINKVVDGFLSKISDARNNTLKAWRELKGREDVIESLKNIRDTVGGVANAIGEAFHKAFPEATAANAGKILKAITGGIRKLTEVLKPSEKTLNNVKDAFSGLFSILSLFVKIGKLVLTVVVSIVKGFLQVGKAFSGIGSIILSGVAALGRWITSATEVINKGLVFEKAGQKIKSAILTIINGVKKFASGIGEVFNDIVWLFKNITSIITNFGKNSYKLISESIDAHISPILSGFIKKIQNGLKYIADAFYEFSGIRIKPPDLFSLWNKIVDGFSKVIVFAAQKLHDFKNYIGDAFGAINLSGESLKNGFKTFFDRIKNGFALLAGAVLYGVSNLPSVLKAFKEKLMAFGSGAGSVFSSLKDKVSTAFSGIKDTTKDALGGVANSLSEFKNKTTSFANGTKKVFSVIGNVFKEFWNVVKDLGLVDLVRIFEGLSFIALTKSLKKMFKGIGAIGDSFKAVKDILETYQKSIKADILVKIALAIGVLAGAVLLLSSIDGEKLKVAAGAVAVLLAELVGAMAIFGKTTFKGTAGSVTDGINNFLGTAALNSTITNIIKIAAGVLILATALEKISKIDSDKLASSIAAISVLMAELVVAFKLMPSNKNMAAIGFGLIELGAALLIITLAIKALGKTDPVILATGLSTIAIALTAITLAIHFMPSGSDMMGTGLGLIEIGVALLIISQAIKSIGKIDGVVLAKGLGGMAIALTEITLAMHFMPSGKDMIGTGLGLIEVGIALGIIAQVMKSVGGMSWGEIGKGLVVFAASLVGLSIALTAISAATGGGLGMILIGAGLAIVGVSFAIIVKTMEAASRLSWSAIGKGLLIFGAALLAVGVAGAILTSAILPIAGLFKILSSIGMTIAEICKGLAQLALAFIALGAAGVAGAASIVAALGILVPGILGIITVNAPLFALAIETLVLSLLAVLESLVPAIVEAVLEMIRGILAVLVDYTPEIGNLLFDFMLALMDVIIERIPDLAEKMPAFIKAIKTLMSSIFENIDTDDFLKGMAGFEILVLITKQAASLKIGMLGKALLGVLQMGVVLTALTGVLALVGLLTKIPGLQDFVDRGGDLLLSVGTAIGKFVGGIVGGIAEGITSVLPAMADDLTAFMNNIKGFVDGASKIKVSDFEGIPSLVGAILAITAAEVFTAIGDFITFLFNGKTSMESFGENLGLLGQSLVSFSTYASNVDIEAVNKSAEATKLLSDIANNLPETDGKIARWIGGKMELGSFGKSLEEFGGYLINFSALVSESDIDSSVILKVSTLGSMLTGMANNLPETGGKLATWFGGKMELGSFGTSLMDFANAFVSFNSTISTMTINEESVKSVVSACDMLSGLADNLPDTGGKIAKWFGGKIDLELFGEQLEAFGNGFKSFYGSISDISVDQTKVSSVKTAAEIMNALDKNLPETDGTISKWFNGGKLDLDEFGEQLEAFGNGFKSFYGTISDMSVDRAKVSSVKIAAEIMNALAKNLPETDGTISKWFNGGTLDLDEFGKQLEAFGNGFKSFYVTISDMSVDRAKVLSVKTAAEIINALAKNLPDTDGTISKWFNGGKLDLDEFGEQLEAFGNGFAAFYKSIADISVDRAKVSSVKIAAEIMNALDKNLPETDGTISKWFNGGKLDLDEFGEQLEAFGNGFAAFYKSISSVSIDKTIVDKVESVAKTMMTLNDNLPDTDGVIAKWFTGGKMDFEEFGKQLEAFGMSFVGFSGYMDSVGNLSNLSTAMTQFGELIKMGQDLSLIDTSVYGEFAKGLKSLGESGLSEFIDAFSNCTEDVNTAVATLFSSIASTLTSKMPTDLAPAIENTCKDILEEFKDDITEDTYKDFAYERIIKTFISGIYDRKEYALNAVKGLCEDIVDKAEEIIKADTFKSMASTNIVDALKDGINSFVSQTFLFSAINNLTASIENLFRSGLNLFSVGQYATLALAQGIWSKSIDVTNAISGICQNAIDTAKKKLDEHSPSKVFDEIGMFIPMAMANGILRLKDDVGDATSALGDTAINSMTNSISSIVDAINSDLNADPVIRPVLDLSEIQNGVGTINGMFSNGIPIGTSINAVGDISGRMSANLYDSGIEEVGGKQPAATYYNFTQNNYSPKALSRKEIYRQTRNQFAAMRG